MVDTMTDNKNRTVSEIKHAFSKHGGNLGAVGSVAYLFEKVGLINYPSGTDEDSIMEAALEAGADDVVTADDGSIEVSTTEENFIDLKAALIDAGLEPVHAEVAMQASTEVALDVEQSQKLMKLTDALEDLDDVQNVYTNADIPAEAFA